MGWINLFLSVRVLREQISMFIIRTYLLAGIGVASRAETDPQGGSIGLYVTVPIVVWYGGDISFNDF